MKHIAERICKILMLVLLVAVITLVAYEHDMEMEQQKVLEALKEEFVTEIEPEPEPEILITEPEEPAVIYCDPVIDFVGLQAENPDIYAWIQIPETEVDYPILQNEEDNYYLNRNLDGSEGYPGCIYSNNCNGKDFSDFITVLYGHNMKNGSMFAGLHQFKEDDFFEQNDTIYVYTAEARYTYQIYAAAAYSDVYIPMDYDVKLAESVEAFCDSLQSYDDSRKQIRSELTETEENRMLVLSTCIANEGEKRYLVVGKLIETTPYTPGQ